MQLAFLLKTLIIKYHVGVLKAQFQRCCYFPKISWQIIFMANPKDYEIFWNFYSFRI